MVTKTSERYIWNVGGKVVVVCDKMRENRGAKCGWWNMIISMIKKSVLWRRRDEKSSRHFRNFGLEM